VVRKIQTSINLTPEIYNIVKTEGLNLSGFVESQLEKYFSVSSIEDLNTKIMEHKTAITALEAKRAIFVDEGTKETREESMANHAWEHAFDVFKLRVDSDAGETGLREWVKGAKATEPLRKSGMQVDEIVHKFLERYHGV